MIESMNNWKHLIVHDVPTGKEWPVAGTDHKVITTCGKFVVYVKEADGEKQVCLGEIAMPEAEKAEK